MQEGSGQSRRTPNQRWVEAKSIFFEALQLPAEERVAWVRQACSEEESLCKEILGFLADHAQADGFLQGISENRCRDRGFTDGDVLAGRFRVVRLLGGGGMGEVFEVEDLTASENLALKTLRPEIAADPALIERLRRELQLSRHITHANVCRVNELWNDKTSAGTPVVFFTMELLKGETLSRRLESGGPLSCSRALPIAKQVAAGLTEAHRLGIVHRDLKPGNVFLCNDGRVVIMDFGLAFSLDAGLGRRTQTGVVMGTPAYMSPEQFAGRTMSVRSDVYAFGVTVFEMLTGRNHPLVSPRSLVANIPPAWDKVILRCFENDPEKRPQSVSEVIAAMEDRRRAPPRWLSIAGLTFCAAAAGTFMWLGRPLAPQPGPQAVTTKLTFDSGLTTDPAVSTDGKTLLYSSDRGERGDANIWMQRLDTGETRQLTDEPGHENSPVISPDGKWIAYRSEGDDTIQLRGFPQGRPVPVARWGQKPRFSPDSKSIAYWTGATATTTSGRIWMVPITGGPPRQLAPEFADARYPEWSADGQHILFRGEKSASQSQDGSDWWVVNLADGTVFHTTAQQMLKNAGVTVQESSAAWRDGLVIFSARSGHSTNLWSLPLSQNGFRVTGGPLRVTTGAEFEVSPALLPDGRIVYSNWRTRANVWRISLGTGELQQVTTGDSIDSKPTVSRTGATLVYARRIGESRNVLWRDLATGAEHQIVANQIVEPVVSSNGRMLAWSHGAAIHLLKAGKSEDSIVCHDCGELLSWTPDDSKLIFLRAGTASGSVVELLDLARGTTSRLISSPKVREVAASPDGRLLAFTSRENGVLSRIYLARFTAAGDAKSWIPLTAADFWADKPTWSNDGLALFYSSRKDGFHCIWRQEIDPRTLRPQGEARAIKHFHVIHLTPFMLSRTAIGLSAGADFLYLNLSSMEGNLWALQAGHTPRGSESH